MSGVSVTSQIVQTNLGSNTFLNLVNGQQQRQQQQSRDADETAHEGVRDSQRKKDAKSNVERSEKLKDTVKQTTESSKKVLLNKIVEKSGNSSFANETVFHPVRLAKEAGLSFSQQENLEGKLNASLATAKNLSEEHPVNPASYTTAYDAECISNAVQNLLLKASDKVAAAFAETTQATNNAGTELNRTMRKFEMDQFVVLGNQTELNLEESLKAANQARMAGFLSIGNAGQSLGQLMSALGTQTGMNKFEAEQLHESFNPLVAANRTSFTKEASFENDFKHIVGSNLDQPETLISKNIKGGGATVVGEIEGNVDRYTKDTEIWRIKTAHRKNREANEQTLRDHLKGSFEEWEQDVKGHSDRGQKLVSFMSGEDPYVADPTHKKELKDRFGFDGISPYGEKPSEDGKTKTINFLVVVHIDGVSATATAAAVPAHDVVRVYSKQMVLDAASNFKHDESQPVTCVELPSDTIDIGKVKTSISLFAIQKSSSYKEFHEASKAFFERKSKIEKVIDQTAEELARVYLEHVKGMDPAKGEFDSHVKYQKKQLQETEGYLLEIHSKLEEFVKNSKNAEKAKIVQPYLSKFGELEKNIRIKNDLDEACHPGLKDQLKYAEEAMTEVKKTFESFKTADEFKEFYRFANDKKEIHDTLLDPLGLVGQVVPGSKKASQVAGEKAHIDDQWRHKWSGVHGSFVQTALMASHVVSSVIGADSSTAQAQAQQQNALLNQSNTKMQVIQGSGGAVVTSTYQAEKENAHNYAALLQSVIDALKGIRVS